VSISRDSDLDAVMVCIILMLLYLWNGTSMGRLAVELHN
jgi:hypothetical protein